MTFGEKIKKLRKEKHLTQEQLADKVGVHSNSVSQWENGVIPRMNKILEISNVLGTSSEYLLNEDNDISSVVQQKKTDDFSFIRDLIKTSHMMIYENGNERFFIPTTSEGFNFVERMRASQSTKDLVVSK